MNGEEYYVSTRPTVCASCSRVTKQAKARRERPKHASAMQRQSLVSGRGGHAAGRVRRRAARRPIAAGGQHRRQAARPHARVLLEPNRRCLQRLRDNQQSARFSFALRYKLRR